MKTHIKTDVAIELHDLLKRMSQQTGLPMVTASRMLGRNIERVKIDFILSRELKPAAKAKRNGLLKKKSYYRDGVNPYDYEIRL